MKDTINKSPSGTYVNMEVHNKAYKSGKWTLEIFAILLLLVYSNDYYKEFNTHYQ